MDIAALRRILECPVCLEVRQGTKVFVCLVGHKICSPCLDDPTIGAANKCPECKGGYRTATTNDKVTLPPRSLDVEALIEKFGEKIDSPCNYSRRGCGVRGIKNSILKHQAVCQHRTVPCPMGTNCENTQDLQLGDLMEHLKNGHNMTSFNGNIKVYLDAKDLSGSLYWDPNYMSFDGHDFVAVNKVLHGVIHTWVVLVGDKAKSEQYVVTIKASGNGCRLKMPRMVHWADRPMGEILAEEKNVFSMEEKILKNFIVDNPDVTQRERDPFFFDLTYNVRKREPARKRKMNEESDDDSSSDEEDSEEDSDCEPKCKVAKA